MGDILYTVGELTAGFLLLCGFIRISSFVPALGELVLALLLSGWIAGSIVAPAWWFAIMIREGHPFLPILYSIFLLPVVLPAFLYGWPTLRNILKSRYNNLVQENL